MNVFNNKDDSAVPMVPDDEPKPPVTQSRVFWMPDKLCKVCYSCESSFTMYRRRHHCRMCGQVFCNQCSQFFIEGAMIRLQGLVRSCKSCHDEMIERAASYRRKLMDDGDGYYNKTKSEVASWHRNTFAEYNHRSNHIFENPGSKMTHVTNLQVTVHFSHQ